MNSLYQSGCNCAGGPNKCECQAGYTCCSQKNNEGVFGLCVKEESGCDTRTGFAKVKSGGIVSPTNEGYGRREGFRTSFRERYQDQDDSDKDCKEWKRSFLILSIVAILLFFMLTCKMMK